MEPVQRLSAHRDLIFNSPRQITRNSRQTHAKLGARWQQIIAAVQSEFCASTSMASPANHTGTLEMGENGSDGTEKALQKANSDSY